jgi:hypothetical protein
MAEFWLLAKVGMVIKGLVWGGYSLAGGYAIRTSVRYIKDYKEAIAKENGVR